MSLYDYQKSQEIQVADYPFYALIMAAMRQADSFNIATLKAGFPEIYDEFEKRYNAPAGRLKND